MAEPATVTTLSSLDILGREEDAGQGNRSTGTGLLLAGTEVTATATELNLNDGLTATAAEVNKLDGIASTAYMTVVEGISFTEDSSGTAYTGTITIPAGAVIESIKVWSTVLWDGTSASMKVGDGTDDDGYFTGINLKATDLLVGEVLDTAVSTNWGGKEGAYLVAASGTRNKHYQASADSVVGVVTPGAADGTAGRTFMTVTYSVPTFVASTNT